MRRRARFVYSLLPDTGPGVTGHPGGVIDAFKDAVMLDEPVVLLAHVGAEQGSRGLGVFAGAR
jgi:hypothetical protein